jgi:hypothetical protein
LEKPRIGILDVIEPANAAVEESRVKNGGWQYSWSRTNRTMNNNKNVHEEKMSKKKTYDGYIKMYEENSKKESFVKTVAKTENGSKDLFNEHVEKVKEIDKKMWDPKQNPKFQCHFWPQFGKRLIPVLRGDKTVFQMKDRARSKEKPENVTMRL